MKTAWALYKQSFPEAYNVASVTRALIRRGFDTKTVNLHNVRVDSHGNLRYTPDYSILEPPDLIVPCNGMRVPIIDFEWRMSRGEDIEENLPSYNYEGSPDPGSYNYTNFCSVHAYKALNIIDSQWPSFIPHSIRAHVLASEKWWAYNCFVNSNNVSFAKSATFGITNNFDFSNEFLKGLIVDLVGEPFILKSVHGSNGEGTELCYTINNLEEVCRKVWAKRPHGKILIQEYINHSAGMVLTVGVCGDTIFPVARIGSIDVPEFKADTEVGRLQVAYKKSKKLQELCVNARKALNVEYARFDTMIDGICPDGSFNYKIIEANCPGGMNVVTLTHNVEFGDVIVQHCVDLYEKRNV